MKTGSVSVKILGNRLALRIHGWGNTGKGARSVLLSEKASRKLVYDLLAKSEDLDSVASHVS
jgi:hypothetical protein